MNKFNYKVKKLNKNSKKQNSLFKINNKQMITYFNK
jgi:hypothetical protein